LDRFGHDSGTQSEFGKLKSANGSRRSAFGQRRLSETSTSLGATTAKSAVIAPRFTYSASTVTVLVIRQVRETLPIASVA
jgi:hypothetical protein